MDVKKTKFLKALSKAYGIIAPACNAVGISRYTYYRWYHGDKEFREKADEIAETQVDFVESKLMQMIENSDASSVIFYLKTKGKNRGHRTHRYSCKTATSQKKAERLLSVR